MKIFKLIIFIILLASLIAATILLAMNWEDLYVIQKVLVIDYIVVASIPLVFEIHRFFWIKSMRKLFHEFMDK